MTTKPKVGARVRWNPTGELGTVVAVSPNGKRVQVKWDAPDPDSGDDTFMYDLTPHASLTVLP